MSSIECPGCSRPKPLGQICCDACITRLPWDLPGVADWRTKFVHATACKNRLRAMEIERRAVGHLQSSQGLLTTT